MSDFPDKKKIRQAYQDVQKHQHIEATIRRFSSNKNDIRQTALASVDLSACLTVLEMGCAFGSFTEALEGRLHPLARITGLDIITEYEPLFLQACKRTGYEGTFEESGVGRIQSDPSSFYDLIICSFALYFFVEMLPDVARILKPGGLFIAITHSRRNMRELIDLIRSILNRQKQLRDNQLLPIEMILDRFSSENGTDLLKTYFRETRQIDFPNTLVFEPPDMGAFVEYYRFKEPFFLTGKAPAPAGILTDVTRALADMATKGQAATMCKDDSIFICTHPLTPGASS